jgi:hypothetical protein
MDGLEIIVCGKMFHCTIVCGKNDHLKKKKKKLSVLIEQQIIIRWQNFQIKFTIPTLASSTTKTGRHDIAEILLKVALKHQKSKTNPYFGMPSVFRHRHGLLDIFIIEIYNSSKSILGARVSSLGNRSPQLINHVGAETLMAWMDDTLENILSTSRGIEPVIIIKTYNIYIYNVVQTMRL